MFPTTNFRTGTSGGPGERVGNAIAAASARTGVDFNYLLNQARIESGFNPAAKARTSSATGLFQFIDQTWLGTVKEHGARHGLGWAADSIQQGRGGRYHVADSETLRTILDLRNDPAAASAMAAEFAADNRAHLESKLGRAVESVDLYLAHFLGPAGAEEFLTAYDADPAASAAAILPAAATANRSIFYREDGSARTLAEIRGRFAEKMQQGGGGPLPPAPLPRFQNASLAPLAAAPYRPARALAVAEETAVRPIAKPAAEYARIQYEMLSNIGANG